MANKFPFAVNTAPDARFYTELARQEMNFEHAVAELVDNSISAGARNIEVHLWPEDDQRLINILVADDAHGISLDDIRNRIMRMGGMGGVPGFLNEHGFGLKNSLAS